MMKRIEKLITDFVEDTGLTERQEMVHGSLYVKLKDQKGFELVGLYDQEYIQKVLRDNKLATPYEKRSGWSAEPKENHD